MSAYILIIEDEPDLQTTLKLVLEQAGFESRVAGEADAARRIIADLKPELILLDWMLPGISGMDFMRMLQRDESTRKVPVIMLTARSQEEDKVWGLEAGAEDYITKPFSSRELVARIRRVLRRSNDRIRPEAEGLKVDDLHLVPSEHQVYAGPHRVAVDLGHKEFKILHFLMSHPNRAHTRDQLMDNVWGRNVFISDRTVDVHMHNLRKALEPWNVRRRLQTVRGVGYRFSA